MLLVGIDTSARRTLWTELTRVGLTVTQADCTDEVLRPCEEWCPSVLCVHHPAFAGFDALDLVRRIRIRDSILPIVLMPERRSEELLLQAVRMGAGDFLPWPLPLQEFVDRVSVLVGEGPHRPRASFQGMSGAGVREADPFIGGAPVVQAIRR